MKISILCVGKIKEKFYKDAITEYAKRLGRYCKFEIIEVADEMTPDLDKVTECELAKQKEGKRIISKLKNNEDMFVVTLEINGKKLNSFKFADLIENKADEGINHICFIIGGSLGLADEVLKCSDFSLSFSDMTFPHQLMRVILSEQIYRAYKIINNEPYHK